MTDFRHEVRFEPGYDYTEADKDKPAGEHRGVHGLQIRFLVHGPEGTIQFLLYTDWIPSDVVEGDDFWGPQVKRPKERNRITDLFPMAADLGYHWDTPVYESEWTQMDRCDLRPSGKCFYDGSGMRAERVLALLITKGHEAVWQYLEREYEDVRARAEETKLDTTPASEEGSS